MLIYLRGLGLDGVRLVGGMLGMLNMFAGGAVERMSIFALALIPYISASIIMQLATVIFPAVKRMYTEDGEAGRTSIAPRRWRWFRWSSWC